MDLSTKQKQTHRHRKQTNGYQRKEEGVWDKQTSKHKININLSGGSDNKEPGCNAKDPGLTPGRRSPGEGNTTHFSILAWKFHGQRSLVGYSPWGHKESDTAE